MNNISNNIQKLLIFQLQTLKNRETTSVFLIFCDFMPSNQF
jgi:hypothetical protein